MLYFQGFTPVVVDSAEFDPATQEAAAIPMAAGNREGQVINHVRRGWRYDGRLIRPALVEVATAARVTVAASASEASAAASAAASGEPAGVVTAMRSSAPDIAADRPRPGAAAVLVRMIRGYQRGTARWPSPCSSRPAGRQAAILFGDRCPADVLAAGADQTPVQPGDQPGTDFLNLCLAPYGVIVSSPSRYAGRGTD